MNFFIGVVVGFLLGTIITCILLAKKNLERKNVVEKAVTASAKNSFQQAKDIYDAKMRAFDAMEEAKEAEKQKAKAKKQAKRNKHR